MVMHSHPSDVSTVFINGEIVKRDGRLLKVDWPELTEKLRENRKLLEDRWTGVDWAMTKSELAHLWHLDGVLE